MLYLQFINIMIHTKKTLDSNMYSTREISLIVQLNIFHVAHYIVANTTFRTVLTCLDFGEIGARQGRGPEIIELFHKR